MKSISALSVFALSLMLVGAGCSMTTTGIDSDSDTGDSTATGAAEGAWAPGVTTKGDLPSTPVAGTINGSAVTIANVTVEDWGDKFQWKFSDKAPSKVCSFTTGDNSVKFRSADLVEGTFTKETATKVDYNEFSSYYVYAKDDGSPHSVNTGWEATIIVTDFNKTVSKDAFGKNVGSIEGYVELAFEDGKTEIAGAFSGDVCEK
ncbi:MAG TPA: hypothetical protein QF873_00340 [Patescibacteria group bacterium]|nr:hypothetical protein [Patescibacteria group bacterium]